MVFLRAPGIALIVASTKLRTTACRSSGVIEARWPRIRQHIEVEGGKTVIGGGVELQGSGHPGARFLLGLKVIDRGEEVDLVVGLVRGKGMGEHRGAFHLQGVVVGHHAAENSDVGGVFRQARILERFLDRVLEDPCHELSKLFWAQFLFVLVLLRDRLFFGIILRIIFSASFAVSTEETASTSFCLSASLSE